MNVICYGDSFTYGYDPRSYFGGRYDADSRWDDILATKISWIIYREGRFHPSLPPFLPVQIC